MAHKRQFSHISFTLSFYHILQAITIAGRKIFHAKATYNKGALRGISARPCGVSFVVEA